MWLNIGKGLNERLDKLEDELLRLRAHDREKSRALMAAQQELQNADDAIIGAAEQDALTIVSGGVMDDGRRKAHAAKAKVDAKIADLRADVKGAARAIERKERELTAFEEAHVAELFEAHTPTAIDARDQFVEALDAVLSAAAAYERTGQRSARLTRLIPDVSGRAVPLTRISTLMSELQRAAQANHPVLLPSEPSDPTIATQPVPAFAGSGGAVFLGDAEDEADA